MLKKDIIFGSVVLLLAALFALTGCSQATNSDGGSTVYRENHLFGTADADDVKAAVESAKASGRSVVLTANVTLQGPNRTATSYDVLPEVADFGDVPVLVEGNVWVTGDIIVNASRAILSFATDAVLITLNNNGTFIYQGKEVGDHIVQANNTGYKVQYVANPYEAAAGTDNSIAVSSHTLGATVAPHVNTLFVVDEVTIPGTAVAPTGGTGNPFIVALGEVDLIENNSDVFGVYGSGYPFYFTRDSVLTTSSSKGVTLGIPYDSGNTRAVAALGTIKPVNPTVPITIAGPGGTEGITTLSINKIEGPGTVTISDAYAIDVLDITNVAATGNLVVDTDEFTGTFYIGGNAGIIAVNTNADFDFADIGNNAGVISVNAGGDIVTGLDVSANSGTINLTSPTLIAGTVDIADNAGEINLTSPISITAAVELVVNSGTLNVDVPTFTAGGISITRNTGAVNFTKPLGQGGTPVRLANFIKNPNNYGTITFQDKLVTGNTAVLGGTAVNKISGSGKVIFNDIVTFGAATVIETGAVFNDNVTAGAALTFDGDVTLDYEKEIVLNITTPSALTLKKGARILVAATPVLAAGGNDVTFTSSASGAKLEAGRLLDETLGDDPATYLGDKTLTLTTQPITATGDLRIVGGGVLELGRNAPGGLTTDSLTLEDGGILAFKDDGVVNTSTPDSVIFGATTTISGGIVDAQARLVAGGGAVTLREAGISGSGALSVYPELGSPDITKSSGVFEISGVNLDLTANGSLTIPSGVVVRLANGANPGKITLGEEFGTTITNLSARYLSSTETGSGNATLGGKGIIRGPDEASRSGAIGDISGATDGSLTITGVNGSSLAGTILTAGTELTETP
jgi:hypothetical protein